MPRFERIGVRLPQSALLTAPSGREQKAFLAEEGGPLAS